MLLRRIVARLSIGTSSRHSESGLPSGTGRRTGIGRLAAEVGECGHGKEEREMQPGSEWSLDAGRQLVSISGPMIQLLEGLWVAA
jgi:hypothetical protein